MPQIAIEKWSGVLLDLDNTLYAYTPCHEAAIAACHLYFNAYVEPIDLATFKERYLAGRKAVKLHNAGTAGSHSRHLYFQHVTGIEQALKLGNLYWSSYIEKMMLKPWVKEFLQLLRAHNKKVAIVTNMETSIQQRKLQKLGIAEYIDALATSEEAGVEKPDQKIFDLALEKLALKATDVVMLGDNIEEDQVGAKNASIDFVLCNS